MSIEPKVLTSETELRDWLRRAIADQLKVPVSDVDEDGNFDSYGLDSVEVVLLAGDLERVTGKTFDATVVFEFPSISMLARYLATAA
jgi:acyl carrier protein